MSVGMISSEHTGREKETSTLQKADEDRPSVGVTGRLRKKKLTKPSPKPDLEAQNFVDGKGTMGALSVNPAKKSCPAKGATGGKQKGLREKKKEKTLRGGRESRGRAPWPRQRWGCAMRTRRHGIRKEVANHDLKKPQKVN